MGRQRLVQNTPTRADPPRAVNLVPSLRGMIDRRLLLNYSVDADVAAAFLPAPFEPQLVNGRAVAGVCLIRLADIRPRVIPARLGMTMENAAHRFAVTRRGTTEHGVYIPRRDTNSPLAVAFGGRAFPGVHHRARFHVEESEERYAVSFRSNDGIAAVDVTGVIGDQLPATSMFGSLTESSAFFEKDSIGWSDRRQPDCFDALELHTDEWTIAAFDVDHVTSSFFSDPEKFPPGSVKFDHALVMRRVAHTWQQRERVHSTSPR